MNTWWSDLEILTFWDFCPLKIPRRLLFFFFLMSHLSLLSHLHLLNALSSVLFWGIRKMMKNKREHSVLKYTFFVGNAVQRLWGWEPRREAHFPGPPICPVFVLFSWAAHISRVPCCDQGVVSVSNNLERRRAGAGWGSFLQVECFLASFLLNLLQLPQGKEKEGSLCHHTNPIILTC